MDSATSNKTAQRRKSENLHLYKLAYLQDDDLRLTKRTVTEDTPFIKSLNHQTKNNYRYRDDEREDYEEKPKCGENTRYYFCEFCDNTSIHGLKFLGERGRYVIEKIWWLLVVIAAVFFSGALIYKSFNKWQSSPIVVTFAMTETPIWQIPFPAITICPETNANPAIFNYTKVYMKYMMQQNTTKKEDEYFNLFSMICNDDLAYVDVNKTKIITEDEFSKFVYSFAELEANDCQWLGVTQNCSEVLSFILTSEGWCSTFNMLEPTDVYVNAGNYFNNNTKPGKWTLELGYPSDAGLDTFPRRTMLSGVKAGFQIDLHVNDDDLDYLCGDLQGFKVALHHPAEVPNMDNHFRVPLDSAVVVGIKPGMITTAEEIRLYKPEDRQCYLPGEKTLSTFKIYTQHNCMAECLANYTLQVCGCVSYYMLSEAEITEICGAGSKKCLEDAKVSFLEQDIAIKMSKNRGKISEQCGCLPACTSINFDSETSQTNWNWRRSFSLKDLNPNSSHLYKKDHFSRMMVYYKDLQFMTSERHELYGWVDFLANCGGLLGLFCGFSFTSLMEIAYYLSLRFICNIRKFGGKFWSGAPELVEKNK